MQDLLKLSAQVKLASQKPRAQRSGGPAHLFRWILGWPVLLCFKMVKEWHSEMAGLAQLNTKARQAQESKSRDQVTCSTDDLLLPGIFCALFAV
jgi:hypothetical protein